MQLVFSTAPIVEIFGGKSESYIIKYGSSFLEARNCWFNRVLERRAPGDEHNPGSKEITRMNDILNKSQKFSGKK